MRDKFKYTKKKAKQLANMAKNLAKKVKEKPVNTFIRVATTHPFITIGLVILITIAIIPGVLKIQLDNNIRGFLGEEFDIVVKTNYVEETFHISKSTFFLTVEADNIYTAESLEYVKLLHEQLSAKPSDIESLITTQGKQYKPTDDSFQFILDNRPEDIATITIDGITHEETGSITHSMIKDVNSIINAVDATSDKQSLETFDYIKKEFNPITGEYYRVIPKTKEQLDTLKELLEDNKDYEGLYYSDRRNTKGNPSGWILTIEIKEESHDEYYKIIEYIEETIDLTRHYGYETKVFGVDYTNRDMNQESQNDLKTQIIIVAIVIMVVFFLNFRTPTGVIIPQVNTIISVFWVFGLMGYFEVKFSIIGLLIVPVLLAVTSSYSIHSLNQYYKDISIKKKNISSSKENNDDSRDSKSKNIADSMSHILTTIAIAGLTTFVSFISLIGSNIIHIKTFGIFAGLGVIISVVLSITFLPSILVIIPQRASKKKKITDFNNTLMDRAIKKSLTFIIKYRYIIFVMFLLLSLVSISGVFYISSDSSFVMTFDPDHRIRKLSQHFSEHIGGVINMMVTIDAAPQLETSIRNTIRNKSKDEDYKHDIINEDRDMDESESDPFMDNSSNENDKSRQVDDPFDDNDGSIVDDPFDDNDGSIVDDPFAEDGYEQEIDHEKIFGEKEEDDTQNDVERKEEHDHILNSKLLKKVERLSSYIETLDNVSRVYSYVDIIKRLNYVYKGKSEDYKKIPDTDIQIKNYKDIFQGEDEDEDGVVDNIDKLVDPLYNKLNMIITLKDKGNIAINSGDYERIEDGIRRYISENFSEMNIDYYITGWSILHKDVQIEIVRGQLISIFFSIFVIFLIISFLFRSPLLGLISIIPLSASIFITLGLMGYIGITLNMSTALISAIAVGIAVDDTIHYMLHLRAFKKELGGDVDIETLIYKTTNFTSKAIIFTSVALIFGFIMLMFSTFIPIRQFANLTAFTLFVATIATLWGLPSIFLCFPRLVGIKKKTGRKTNINKDISE